MFLVIRQAVVPAGFGQYGHFRAGALKDVRSRPMSFAGRSTCEACHDEQLKVLSGGKHAHVGCESCHGAQAKHANDPSATPVLPDTKILCAKCHEQNSAKPKGFPQVATKDHSGGEAGKTCHKPHRPKFGEGS